MNFLKEITLTTKNHKKEFEKPFFIDLENLKNLSTTELKTKIFDFDRFCEEILQNQKELEIKINETKEEVEDWREKHRQILLVNKQVIKNTQTHNLDKKCINVVKESLIRIFGDDKEEIEHLRKYLKKKNLEENEDLKKNEEIIKMFSKLIQTVDKLYLGKLN